jgi:WD40 repeat protein
VLVPPTANIADAERSSPWGGLSGALVFYAGVALGVVVQHQPRQGSSALRLVPFDRIAAATSPETQALAAALGLPSRDELPLVPREEDAGEPAAPAGDIDISQERARHGTIHGRQQVFETVLGWIADAPKGWILVKGGPGTGKSAILSALLDRLEAAASPELVPHHFLRRGQGNWDEPDAVLRNLTARLERICGAAVPSSAPGMERLYALLVEAAARMADRGQRLVLVVDGLDEAAVPPGESSGLGRFLPAALPDGVFVLCASRPNYPYLGWLEQRPGLRVVDLNQPPWSDDNLRLVEAFWHDRGPRLKPPLDDETLEAAIAAAQGNILHAVTLCDAFEADTQARDPQRIPVSFEALLEDMWLRLVDLDDRAASTQVLDGLGLLAVAGEALPLTVLAALLDWNHPAEIATFKRYALPFLLEEDAAWHGGEARFRPFHEKTREFLTTGDRMSAEARRRKHELLAGRLAAWPPGDDAGEFEHAYAARYALFHASQARDWTRVTALLADLRHIVAAVGALGPQLLLARLADVEAVADPPGLAERAAVLRRVLRQESQWLEDYPGELPNALHNRLTSVGWSRDRIASSFSGFDRGWGLVNAVDVGDEICIFRGHTSSVQTCDIDAEGRLGVSAGWDGTVRIWDLARGADRLVIHLDPADDSTDVDSCAISEDGRFVAAVTGRVRAWRTDDAHLVLDHAPDGAAPVRVTFASGHTLVVMLDSGAAEIHDLADGTSRVLAGDGGFYGEIDVDPAGELLAFTTLTEGGVAVRRLSDGSDRYTVKPEFEGVSTCSFSRDGRYLAVASSDSAAIADAADGTILFTSTSLGQVSDCRLLDRTRLVYTSGWDCGVVVWDMESDVAVVTYEGHTYTAECCAVTREGLYALSGGGDNTVRLWSLDEQVAPTRPDRHVKLVYGCTVDDDAAVACSAPQDDVPAVWDARTGTRLPVRVLPKGVAYGNVRFCRFGGRSSIAALGGDLRVYEPETAKCVWKADIPVRDQYGDVSWLDSGNIESSYTGNDQGPRSQLPLLHAGSHVILWREGADLEPVKIRKEATVTRLDAGRSIATLADGVVELIDLAAARRSSRKVADGVAAFTGSPGARVLYVLTQDHRICRLDADSGETLQVLGEFDREAGQLLVDPQETAVWALSMERRTVTSAAEDQAQRIAAFATDGTGLLQQADITGHKVFGSCFLGTTFVTAGWDATLRIWDPRAPMPLATIPGSSAFRCVDAAGDRIVAGDQKGNVWFLAPMAELYP